MNRYGKQSKEKKTEKRNMTYSKILTNTGKVETDNPQILKSATSLSRKALALYI